jgi:hypothetical protein
VQVCGRAANVNDLECSAELSTVTRWQIGGSGTSDADVPPLPYFGLGAGPRGGTVELSGVSFTDLTNTSTISSATLTLHYWDELGGRPGLALAQAAGADDTSLELSAAGNAIAGSLVQIDGEVIRVESVENSGMRYVVTRGMHNSPGVAHAAQAAIYPLQNKPVIAAFPPNFFGSPYSGSWTQPVTLPDVRVASAELFVTNRRGNSPVRSVCLTSAEGGLRTLSGGQYSIQVDGFLAVEDRVAPALVVEASHSVRDVFAVLGTAADAEVSLRVDVDGAPYCTLSIQAGMATSAAVDGNKTRALIAGTKVTLAVLAVGQTYPGSNLTVIIRL